MTQTLLSFNQQRGEVVSAKDYGAIGDGVADDTAAIQSLITAVNAMTVPVVINFDGTFLVDLLAVTNNRYEITKSDLLIEGGGSFVVKAGNYSTTGGAFKFYIMFYVKGSRVTVRDLLFDGNNQFAQYPSSPSLSNHWFLGVAIEGESGAYTEECIVESCRYINGGGWPFRGQLHRHGRISGCYMENSQGCGFDTAEYCVVSGNISIGAHDAHYGTWNSKGAVIDGNIAKGTDNGSGVDVSGATDCVVSNNTIEDVANRGIWVLQDPNTPANKPKNVAIIGNTFLGCNTFAVSEMGDITVGVADVTTDSRPPGTVDCDGLTIVGNTFETINGANSITLGQYSNNTLIEGNTFKDDAANAASRGISIYNATNVIARNNQDLIQRRKGTNSEVKVLGNGPVWFDGVDSHIDDSAANVTLNDVKKSYYKQTARRTNALKDYTITEYFGSSIFSSEFDSVNGSKNICDVGFTAGGFSVVDIEIIVCVGGGRGVRRTRVTYQGTNSTTPTQIVAAADEYSGGTTPPTITFTASTGNVRIAMGSNGVLNSSAWIRFSGTSFAVENVTSLL